MERGKITNGWLETLAAEQRADEVTPESLATMLDKVEENLDQFTGLMHESRKSAKDYGAALQEQAKDLADVAEGEPVLVREKNMLLCTSHPELVTSSVHRLFLARTNDINASVSQMPS